MKLYRRLMKPPFDRKPPVPKPQDQLGTQAHEPRGIESVPRYLVIKQSICDAVRDGRLRPGDRVPSEAELVQQFEVSRMTANRAVRELQAAGVVVRRAGSGSFIAEPR